MIQPGETPVGSQLIETPSGLLVSADAADNLNATVDATNADASGDGKPKRIYSRDPDGRRRIVLTREDRKALNRAIRILDGVGLGIVVGCKFDCGQPLTGEGRAKDNEPIDPDQGYGCRCSRVHFR